jgi:hypothetical protein
MTIDGPNTPPEPPLPMVRPQGEDKQAAEEAANCRNDEQ